MKNQKGIAIISSILVVSVILSIVLALSAVFIPTIRIAVDVKNSVPAIYAAESALEWCLYRVRIDDTAPRPIMGNDSKYNEDIDCLGATIKAVGTYHGVTRAFEVSF